SDLGGEGPPQDCNRGRPHPLPPAGQPGAENHEHGEELQRSHQFTRGKELTFFTGFFEPFFCGLLCFVVGHQCATMARTALKTCAAKPLYSAGKTTRMVESIASASSIFVGKASETSCSW